MRTIFYGFFVIICCSTSIFGQWNKGYFTSPMDIKLRLSGNFGEVRGNHFHSGIDFKTDSMEGKAIYAAAAGFVSRIKTSTFGFGNVIYIDHPNGLTTVYAHLHHFMPSLDSALDYQQLEQKKFEIDWYPPPNTFMVSKGELIGYSGNSGSSAGPHLHFEVRNTNTERVINPFLFDFNIDDSIPPFLKKLLVYDGNKVIEERTINESGGEIFLAKPILTGNAVGFGFVAYDKMNNTYNTLGIYTALLVIDNDTVWHHRLDSFAFDESICVNAYIDYARDYLYKQTVERLYKLPGNDFMMMEHNMGIVPGKYKLYTPHKARLVLCDEWHNCTTLHFEFMPQVAKKSGPEQGAFLYWNKPFKFSNGMVIVEWKDHSLFKNEYFNYSSIASKKNGTYTMFQLGKEYTTLRKAAIVSIRIPVLPKYLQTKLVMTRKSKNGEFVSIGGTKKGNYIVASTKNLGVFALALDTVAPKIIPLFDTSTTYTVTDTLFFRVTDKLSGLDNYKLLNNDTLTIIKHDAKYNLLYVEVKKLTSGINTLKLLVDDKCNNSATYMVAVIRQ